MIFEHIEKLKRDYTDRFVTVDPNLPELARFKGQTGRVKTINMNGKALVEFQQYANIGWFDIDVDYLKVVERPVPVEEPKKTKPAAKAAKKPAPAKAAESKLSPLELARQQGAAGKKAEPAKPAGKPSTADILAAARGGGKTEKPSPEKAASEPTAGKKASEMSLQEKLAMMRGEKGAAAAPARSETPPAEQAAQTPAKDLKEMTLQEKLAYMRSEKAPAEAPAEAEQAPTEPEAASEPEPPTESAPAAAEQVDKSSMSIADMIAWCQQHDAS